MNLVTSFFGRKTVQQRHTLSPDRGKGLSAKCAEAGGADLIIIDNSGRYRMAGRGSLSGLQPYGDANAIVVEIDRRCDRCRDGEDARRLVLCHGGPICKPDDAAYILEQTDGVVGFFGASSMERLPTETAMTENMRRFKAIATGKGKV